MGSNLMALSRKAEVPPFQEPSYFSFEEWQGGVALAVHWNETMVTHFPIDWRVVKNLAHDLKSIQVKK